VNPVNSNYNGPMRSLQEFLCRWHP